MLMDGWTDERTDGRTDGQALLWRCEDASKKADCTEFQEIVIVTD